VDGEGEVFVETSTDFDHQRAAVGEDGSRDVTTGKSPAEKIWLAVDLNRSLCIDSPDEGDPASGQRKAESTSVIPIRRQGKAGREGPEVRSVALEPLAWISGADLRGSQGPMRLVEVVVAQEGLIGASEGAEIGAGVAEDSLLPEIVEALHVGISPRFSGRDKEQMDAQEQMQPHDQREAVGVPAPAGRRHLIVDLGDPRKPQPAPGLHEMLTEQLGGLVAALGGRHAAADHGEGVDRVEAADPLGTPEMAGSHEVGLVKVSGEAGAGSRIGLATALSAARAPLGVAVPPEDPLDRAEGRQGTHSATLQLELDHFGPNSSKAGTAGPRLLQGFSDLHHAGDHPIRGAPSLPLGRSATRPESCPSLIPVTVQPLGQPGTDSPQALQDDLKSNPLSVQLDCPTSKLILIARTRHGALPGSEILGRLSPILPSKSSRCGEGSQVLDVMKVTP
jgi:hypothetical protein